MSRLHGHDEAVAAFRAGLSSGRLHHAWLLAGPQGIGKALFAHKAATRLLAEGAGPAFDAPGLEVPDDHPVARLVEAGSHPDLMRLERLPRDDKWHDRPKSDWPEDVDYARSISVHQVRGLQRLFATTSSLSPRRVVIIDSIDDLERPAANALLKNLEEPPPHSLFLLVSHSPARLLPTIRSRCRPLRLNPLERDAMAAALAQALPDASETEIVGLAEAGEGSPGRALGFRGLDIGGIDAALDELAQKGDPTNARRSALAQSLALKAAQARYESFLQRAPARIAAAARQRSGAALGEAVALWERASALASSAMRLSLDPASVVFELSGMVAGLAPRR